MFDLENAIVQWRARMGATGIKDVATLAELEAHLREEIEQQMKSGWDDRHAFEIAVGGLGTGTALETEFKKVNRNFGQPSKGAAAIAFALILAFYSLVVAGFLINEEFTTGERWSGFGALVTTLVSVYLAARVLPRFFPVIASRTVQSLLGIVGGISGAVWMVIFFDVILPRCDFTLGQLRVAALWAFAPMVFFPAAIFLVLDKSETQDAAATDSTIIV